MAKEKIIVDGETFTSRKKAMAEFLEGMLACEGSESDRYCFAYEMLREGYSVINTYKETAEM